MRNYEVTFIVDPVLSGDEIKATAQKYVNHLQENNCGIVNIDEMGLRQLAYEINKRHAGYYYSVEFQSEVGSVLAPLELTMHRDERLLRYITVKLDKYGIKYNEDKRSGLIGKIKKKKKAEPSESSAHHQQQQQAKPKPVKPPIQQPDNLKRIEGIGPKIAEALRAVGINSFTKIASMTPDEIKTALMGAGDRFSFQDPGTWPAQAAMAASGDWDRLKKWQEELKAGKVEAEAAAAAEAATAAATAATAAAATAATVVAAAAAAPDAPAETDASEVVAETAAAAPEAPVEKTAASEEEE